MANLDDAKKQALKMFQSSLPPGSPEPTSFSINEQFTRPLKNLGVVNQGAMAIIDGSLVPGSDSTAADWSTAHNYGQAYLTEIQNMAYGLSTADQNKITTLTANNQNALNELVTIYEQTYGRITDAQLTTAGLTTKIDYVTAKLPAMKASLNWAKFQPTYNSAQADMDILANINSNKVTFGNQLTAIKTAMLSASAVNGGTQTFDANNNKVWVPGYNVDPNFPTKFANGQTATVKIELKDVGQNSSSFNIDGNAGGSFGIGWLGVSGSTSAEYQQSDFQELMSSVTIELTYTNVCFLTTSPSVLSTDNATGWFAPALLKAAYNRNADSSGPFFVTDEENSKAALESGSLNSILGFLVSAAASGTMTFAKGSYESFQKYFHTETHASVNLFGFIPIATANTSYTDQSSGSHSSGSSVVVALNPAKDKNNLVVHGGILEKPIA
jgi:hypothetical protein